MTCEPPKSVWSSLSSTRNIIVHPTCRRTDNISLANTFGIFASTITLPDSQLKQNGDIDLHQPKVLNCFESSELSNLENIRTRYQRIPLASDEVFAQGDRIAGDTLFVNESKSSTNNCQQNWENGEKQEEKTVLHTKTSFHDKNLAYDITFKHKDGDEEEPEPDDTDILEQVEIDRLLAKSSESRRAKQLLIQRQRAAHAMNHRRQSRVGVFTPSNNTDQSNVVIYDATGNILDFSTRKARLCNSTNNRSKNVSINSTETSSQNQAQRMSNYKAERQKKTDNARKQLDIQLSPNKTLERSSQRHEPCKLTDKRLPTNIPVKGNTKSNRKNLSFSSKKLDSKSECTKEDLNEKGNIKHGNLDASSDYFPEMLLTAPKTKDVICTIPDQNTYREQSRGSGDSLKDPGQDDETENLCTGRSQKKSLLDHDQEQLNPTNAELSKTLLAKNSQEMSFTKMFYHKNRRLTNVNSKMLNEKCPKERTGGKTLNGKINKARCKTMIPAASNTMHSNQSNIQRDNFYPSNLEICRNGSIKRIETPNAYTIQFTKTKDNISIPSPSEREQELHSDTGTNSVLENHHKNTFKKKCCLENVSCSKKTEIHNSSPPIQDVRTRSRELKQPEINAYELFDKFRHRSKVTDDMSTQENCGATPKHNEIIREESLVSPDNISYDVEYLISDEATSGRYLAVPSEGLTNLSDKDQPCDESNVYLDIVPNARRLEFEPMVCLPLQNVLLRDKTGDSSSSDSTHSTLVGSQITNSSLPSSSCASTTIVNTCKILLSPTQLKHADKTKTDLLKNDDEIIIQPHERKLNNIQDQNNSKPVCSNSKNNETENRDNFDLTTNCQDSFDLTNNGRVSDIISQLEDNAALDLVDGVCKQSSPKQCMADMDQLAAGRSLPTTKLCLPGKNKTGTPMASPTKVSICEGGDGFKNNRGPSLDLREEHSLTVEKSREQSYEQIISEHVTQYLTDITGNVNQTAEIMTGNTKYNRHLSSPLTSFAGFPSKCQTINTNLSHHIKKTLDKDYIGSKCEVLADKHDLDSTMKSPSRQQTFSSAEKTCLTQDGKHFSPAKKGAECKKHFVKTRSGEIKLHEGYGSTASVKKSQRYENETDDNDMIKINKTTILSKDKFPFSIVTNTLCLSSKHTSTTGLASKQHIDNGMETHPKKENELETMLAKQDKEIVSNVQTADKSPVKVGKLGARINQVEQILAGRVQEFTDDDKTKDINKKIIDLNKNKESKTDDIKGDLPNNELKTTDNKLERTIPALSLNKSVDVGGSEHIRDCSRKNENKPHIGRPVNKSLDLSIPKVNENSSISHDNNGANIQTGPMNNQKIELKNSPKVTDSLCHRLDISSDSFNCLFLENAMYLKDNHPNQGVKKKQALRRRRSRDS